MSASLTRGEPLHLLMTADAVGGVWPYALDLAADLAGLGIKTTLAVLGLPPTAGQARTARAIPGLELAVTGLPLDWTAREPEEVRAAGRHIARLAGERGADVVQLNAPALGAGGPFPVPMLAVAHSCLASWWWTVRRDEELPADFRWRTELFAEGLAGADALVAPTAAFAETLRRIYGLAEGPRVVHNGRRALLERPGRTGGSAFAFTAGRLWDEGKDVATLDRAAARLSLPILAAGPLEGPNGAVIRPRHIRALGPLPDKEVARWLAAGPVFVSAARYEPFGLAVLEAAQAGCPLILADIATFRELWDGAAEFVPPGDDEAFAHAIEQAASDPGHRARLAEAARQRAQEYSAEAMARTMAEIHRDLAKRAGAKPSPRKEAAA